MKSISSTLTGIALLTMSFTFEAGAQLPAVIYVNPMASYLLVNNDPAAANPIPIDLASLGISPGELIGLTAQGSFFVTHQSTDPNNQMSGVFSSSATLLASNQLNRVPGAIAAGTPYISPDTYRGGIPTDIPQDFSIFPANTTIRVPPGATYLFVAAKDVLYKDNVTNPNDPLRLLIVRENDTILSVSFSWSDRALHVSWNTVSNQLYQLQSATSLIDGWTNVGEPVQGTGAAINITVVTATESALFFRVERVP